MDNISFAFGVVRVLCFRAYKWLFGIRDPVPLRTIEVLCLGREGKGKSTLLAIAAHEDTSNIAPTKGFAIKAFQTATATFHVKEIGGNEKLRPHWHRYYSDAEGVIVVIAHGDDSDVELAKELAVDERISGPRLILVNHMAALPNTAQEAAPSSFPSSTASALSGLLQSPLVLVRDVNSSAVDSGESLRGILDDYAQLFPPPPQEQGDESISP